MPGTLVTRKKDSPYYIVAQRNIRKRHQAMGASKQASRNGLITWVSVKNDEKLGARFLRALCFGSKGAVAPYRQHCIPCSVLLFFHRSASIEWL